jgi:hypothetical protein
MQTRAILSGLALALFVGFSASAATVSGASGAGPAAAPAPAVDMNLLNAFMNGRPLVVAQQACVMGGNPCDDQHPCCRGYVCRKGLFDKQAVCDSNAS